MSSILIQVILTLAVVGNSINPPTNHSLENIQNHSLEYGNREYHIGDIVRSSNFENESYWVGKIVRKLKGVLYQIELKRVVVNGTFTLYLSASDCTGQKRISYEDGADYNQTKIWIHERCLD